MSKHGRGSKSSEVSCTYHTEKAVDKRLQAVESRQLRKVELAHRGGLEGSRNDRSPVKTRFMAFRDYIAKYMASNDFKATDE